MCFCPRLLHDVTSPVFLRHFGRRLTWLQAEEECQRHYGHLVRGKSKRRLLLASTREINARLSHTTVSKKASSPSHFLLPYFRPLNASHKAFSSSSSAARLLLTSAIPGQTERRVEERKTVLFRYWHRHFWPCMDGFFWVVGEAHGNKQRIFSDIASKF